ncbi:MAG TPA: ABC transporter permease, partial [Candidatus Deferrimicrobium sp.]|nr:ABC transporter permease [Candidatus Deferrimicrobium sp.]
MRRYLLGRLLRIVPVAFGVVTVVFLLIHLLPGDPVEIMLGESAVPAQKEELRRELRLDRPILSQYGSFLAGIPRGDLGVSFRSREPVLGEIARRVPATVLLAATSI